jgi:putative ABC transport system permease protein
MGEWKHEVSAALLRHPAAAKLTPPEMADVVEEWAQHAEAAWTSARADGLSDAEARAKVAQQIDGWCASLATTPRRRNSPPAIDSPPATARGLVGFWQDVRYGWRVLLKQPGFSIVAVATTALAIGATTTLFSVADGVLTRPLPFSEPDRLIRLSESREGATRQLPTLITHATYQLWRDKPTTIEGVAGFSPHPVTVGSESGAQRILGFRVTASFFDVLRTRPQHGVTFQEADEAQGRPPVVVLSHALWRDRFGSDPGAVGKTLELDGVSHHVAGIMPEGFAFPTPEVRFWTPLYVPPATPPADGSSRISLFGGIARLQPGATVSQAAAEATARAQAGPPPAMVDTAVFGSRGAQLVTAVPLIEFLTGEVRPAILVFLAAVGLLFLTAIANISSLQLARSTSRRRELAIRAALGAGTRRLARQLLIESALLGLAGGVAGLALAVALHAALPTLLPSDFPRVGDVVINARAVLFAAGAAALAGLLFGLLPVWHVWRVRLVSALSEDSQAPVGLSIRTSVGRLRMAIIVGQVAAASVLLVGALLLGRSFSALWNADRGYEPSNLLTAKVVMPDRAFTAQARLDVMKQLISRTRAMPGVTGAAFSTVIPMSTNDQLMGFTLPPRAGRAEPINAQTAIRVVSPGFFRALGIELAAGRGYDETDTPAAPRTVVVNETFARAYLDGQGVGARVPLGGGPASAESEVIGIIRDVQPSTRGESPRPEVYFNADQSTRGLGYSEPMILLRTAGDPMTVAPALRQLTQEIDSRIALDSVMTMEGRLAAGLSRPRLYAVLLSALSVLALVIAGVGVFGVLSYNVAQRRREIGVRAALGARPSDIVRLTVGQGVGMAVAGLAVGLSAAFWLVRYLEGLLWGVSARDPLSYAVVPLVLLAATIVACWVPARRAARIDPLTALKR